MMYWVHDGALMLTILIVYCLSSKFNREQTAVYRFQHTPVWPTEQTDTYGDHWSNSSLVTIDQSCIAGLRITPNMESARLL